MNLRVLLSTPTPTPSPTVVEVSATLGSPGLLGFVVTFAVAVAVVLLARSMSGHLRRVARGAPDREPPAEDEPPAPGRGEQP